MLRPLRRFAVAALVLVIMCSTTQASAQMFTTSDTPRITRTTLANGLRVDVIENHMAPLVQVAMYYGIGSADDPAGRSGLAHALEHMMFRGTRSLSGAGLDDLEARLGAETNADTDFELTRYYQTVPVDALDVTLHVEADRMRGLRLRAADWNLERGAVLAELAGYATSDRVSLEDAVRAAVFRGTPYARSQAGTPDDVRRIGIADLRRAYDAAYQPDNATIVVTGDIDPVPVVAKIDALFGGIRGHATLARRPVQRPVVPGATVRLEARAERLVDVALPSHGYLGPHGIAEEIAIALLQPEHRALRGPLVERGPCSAYEADDERRLRGGLVHVICHVRDGRTSADALAAVQRAIAGLARHLPAGSIAYARRDDIANTDFTIDSLNEEAELFGQSLVTLDAGPRELDRRGALVPAADVIAILRRWTTPAGIGVADRATSRSIANEPDSARAAKGEHVPAPSQLEPVVQPGWAVVTPLRPPPQASVATFTLRNGLRILVRPRRGNGTVYVRGGFDTTTLVADSPALRERIARIAERHGVIVQVDTPMRLHAHAGELATILAVLGSAWLAPRMPHTPARVWDFPAQPRHAWIAVTGDVDPRVVLAGAEQRFGAWRNTVADPKTPAVGSLSARTSRPFRTSFGPRTPRARAFFVERAPRRGASDVPAMMVLNAVLGANGDFDTRLMRELRVRRGLVYSTASQYDPDEGLLALSFEASNRDFAAARATLRSVVRGLQNGPVTPAELARAQRKLLAAALRAEANPDGILDVLQQAAEARRPPDDFETLRARYEAVTVRDVEREARERLRPERFSEIDEGVGRGPESGSLRRSRRAVHRAARWCVLM